MPSAKDADRTPPEFYVYQDMYEVPPEWRTLRGYRLHPEQVNWIIKRAYEHGSWSTGSGHDPVFVPDYGGAREDLLEATEVQNGFLVPRRADA